MSVLHWRRRTALALICLLPALACGRPAPPLPASIERRPLTIAAGIESARFMTDASGESVFVSPDGRRYAFMVIRGDLAADRLEAELWSGRLDDYENVAPYEVVRLLTRGLGRGYVHHAGGYELTWPASNPPRWLDERRIGLLWEDVRGVKQAISIDVAKKRMRYLTAHDSDVTHFALSPQGDLLYTAIAPCDSVREPRAQGRVVTAYDVSELLSGCAAWRRRDTHRWLTRRGASTSQRVAFEQSDPVNRAASRLGAPVFSRSGRFAIVDHTIASTHTPHTWRRYRRTHLKNILAEREVNAQGPYATQLAQLFILDLRTAVAKPLWNAPANSARSSRIAWSSDETRLLIGPTFTPIDHASQAGLAGEAVLELETASGRVRPLPIPGEIARRITGFTWVSDERVQVDLEEGARLILVRVGDRWRAGMPANAQAEKKGAPVQVVQRRSLNTPPRLFAVDTRRGQEKVLFDPNMALFELYALGRVEWIEYLTRSQRRWQGRLYHPLETSSSPAPLVVQTHTYASREEFSLYGKGGAQPALGPGGSVYVAQALAGAGIAVLHGGLVDLSATESYLEETQAEIAAFEEVIDTLVVRGVIDGARVGIMGHSSSGFLVAYAITHSPFPYAAAITDDNKDGGYFQAGISNWAFGLGEEMIGAAPFAEGLQQWLKVSPTFNVHRIRAPLMMTLSSPGVELGAWELFSRLRHLDKPVELFLIPAIEQGSHGLQNPHQVLTLQQRALDWWRFWLKDEQRDDPLLAAQYAGWQALKAQRDQNARH